MPPESQSSKRARLLEILPLLDQAYPEVRCELTHSNPLELLIATILSAQCTDKQVNIVTADLFAKYKTASDYASADPAELENNLRRIGLFRNKAKNIRACCAKLVALHDGLVPNSMESLVLLDGVGRKTANVVLGNAFGISVGIVVDTHVARLSQRLRFTTETAPEKIERALVRLVPKTDWTTFSHWLIWHGRRRCIARKPDCAGCELKLYCPSVDAFKTR
ncbi:MAG: endonuclease III [Verrucomicrobia bacterium]|nr:endonuclease III [Verrucomicrobiota bacterium]